MPPPTVRPSTELITPTGKTVTAPSSPTTIPGMVITLVPGVVGLGGERRAAELLRDRSGQGPPEARVASGVLPSGVPSGCLRSLELRDLVVGPDVIVETVEPGVLEVDGLSAEQMAGAVIQELAAT